MESTFKLGFSYQDADVANAMKDVKTSVMIINSKLDSLTPYFMGKDIYDTIQEENKEIWTVDESEHCEMWIDYNQEYCDRAERLILGTDYPERQYELYCSILDNMDFTKEENRYYCGTDSTWYAYRFYIT